MNTCKKSKNGLFFHWILFLLLMHSNIAVAATVHLAGPDVDFYYDDSQAGIVYYGNPEVSDVNNMLIFSPTMFTAMSVDGVGTNTGTATDAISSSFTFRAVLRTNDPLTAVDVRERGDYRMSGSPTFVSADAAITVTETADIANSVFENLVSGSDFSIVDGNLHPWESSASTRFNDMQWAGVGDVLITLQNDLSAGSGGVGSSAYIQKTVIGQAIVVSVNQVPLPGSVWLLISGMLLFVKYSANCNGKRK